MKYCVYRWYDKLYLRKMNPRLDHDMLAICETLAEARAIMQRLAPIQQAFQAEQAAADVAYRARCQAAAAVRDAAMREVVECGG